MKFVARPLSLPWQEKYVPVLAVSDTRLVVAAGNTCFIYGFSSESDSITPAVSFEAAYNMVRSDDGKEATAMHDITAIKFVPDNEGRKLLVGFADGVLIRVLLPEHQVMNSQHRSDLAPKLEHIYSGDDIIKSLSTCKHHSLTLTGSGRVTFRSLSSDIYSEIHLHTKSWASHISVESSPYAALGTTSPTPLAIYPITESSLSPLPATVLSSVSSGFANLSVQESSAVYGICDPPITFPGAPGQLLIAGWYDGIVRLYDLRSPSSSPRFVDNQTHTTPVLRPVISMCDPWSTEPIYTVAAGGGEGHTVAAGSARHSVATIWDMRNTRNGWSVYAPGNDSSPVYSVIIEHSRLFGATQSRPFVLDFGPGVNERTYPSIPHAGGRLNSALRTTDGIRYNVTAYQHRAPMINLM